MAWKKPSKTKEPENLEKAYEYALFLLSLRLRTEGEVREKMQKQQYKPGVIQTVIEKLTNQKYLNDQRYAEIFLENLKQYKTFGFYGIKKKLLEKKLPKAIIESVLTAGLSIDDEIKIAMRFLKKTGVVLSPKVIKEVEYQIFNSALSEAKQKLAHRLQARGFRSEVVSRVVF